MPTPSLNVVFEQAAKTAIARSGNGRCAIAIWRDTIYMKGLSTKYVQYTDISQVTDEYFDKETNLQIKKMFENGVKEIIAIPIYCQISDIVKDDVITLPDSNVDSDVSATQAQAATTSEEIDVYMPDVQKLPDFDYIFTTFSDTKRLFNLLETATYPDLDMSKMIELSKKISQYLYDAARLKNARILHSKEQGFDIPNDEYSIIFDAWDIDYNGTHISPFEYLPELMSIIATTPLDRSATYTELPGITSATYVELENKNNLSIVCKNGVYRLSKAVTAYTGDSKDLKSIKIVNAMKILQNDIISTYEDRYIGKAGNLINKMQFVSAVNTYLTRLVEEGVLYDGFDNTAEIDIDAVKAYLADVAGKDISDMSELDIMNAKTGTNLFLKLNVQFADALEDMTLRVVMN